MVFFPETDSSPHSDDNDWQATIRDYVQNITPYRSSRMRFEKNPPPALNPVDAFAPMALMAGLLAFFVWV